MAMTSLKYPSTGSQSRFLVYAESEDHLSSTTDPIIVPCNASALTGSRIISSSCGRCVQQLVFYLLRKKQYTLFKQPPLFLRLHIQTNMRPFIFISVLLPLVLASPIFKSADSQGDQIPGMTETDVESGGCHDVTLIFARGSGEIGNMVRPYTFPLRYSTPLIGS